MTTADLAALYESTLGKPRTVQVNAIKRLFFVRVRAAGTLLIAGVSYTWSDSEGTVYRQDLAKAKARNAQAKKQQNAASDPAHRGIRSHRVVGLPAGFSMAELGRTIGGGEL